MAETKAERTESWKKTTSAHAAALRKAKATVYHPSTGKSGRTIPLTAQTPEEVEAITAGAAKDLSGKPTALINQLYMGPGTGPGITVSPIVTHAQRVTDQESAQRIADIQQQQFEEKLRSPIQTGIVSPLHKVAEPVIKEYEAGISTKPTTTDKPPEYVPTPYKPGTLPGDVEYGERPKFDQPQIHDIIKEKILSAEYIWSRVGDPVGLRHRQLPITLPFYGAPEEQAEQAEKQIGMAPGAAADVLWSVGTGYVFGAAAKLGILGARYVVGYGAGKVARKIPDIPVTVPPSLIPTHQKVSKFWSGKKLDDPGMFDIGKFAQGAITNIEGLIEPAVGLGFAGHIIKDIATTPGDARIKKILELSYGYPGAAKGFDLPKKMKGIWSTRGRKAVSPESITAPEVIAGKRMFPDLKKGETFDEYVLRFKAEKLPSEKPKKLSAKELSQMSQEELTHYRAWRGITESTRALKTTEAGKQFPIKQRHPSDMPASYVSPEYASPYFFIPGKSISSEIPFALKRFLGDTQPLTPRLYRIEALGVRRIPPGIRESVERSQKFIREEAEPGYFYTSKALERKLGGARGGKKELEAVLTGETLLKTTGEQYYVKYGGIRVPIDEVTARINQKQAKIDLEIGIKSKKGTAFKKESELEYYVLVGKSHKKYVPPPKPSEYVPPPKPSEYVPPPKPSEYVPAPKPSRYVPAPKPSEYPPPPTEYVPPQPSTEYPPPPVPITSMYMLTPPTKKPAKTVRKEIPGYAWDLVNPIATLEQLLGVRESPKKRRNKKKSSKRTKTRRSKR